MNFFNNYIYNHYYLSILIFNILSYIFLLFNIFMIFFLFDLKYVKTISDLKFFGNLPFITVLLVLIMLSFAGIPPLLGFISKFFIFIFIIYKNNFLFLFLFTFSNMFIIYFYIQNLRFITSKKINNKFYIKNNFINFSCDLIFLLNFLTFFNIFTLFYFDDFIIFLNLISSSYFF